MFIPSPISLFQKIHRTIGAKVILTEHKVTIGNVVITKEKIWVSMLFANAVRAEKLRAIRQALNVVKLADDVEKPLITVDPCCPDCGKNHWHYVGVIKRYHWKPG